MCRLFRRPRFAQYSSLPVTVTPGHFAARFPASGAVTAGVAVETHYLTKDETERDGTRQETLKFATFFTI